MYFLWYLLIGLVAGWLVIFWSKDTVRGLVVNLIVGIVGGILGGWILSLLGLVAVRTLGSLIASVVGAVVLLWIASLLARSSKNTPRNEQGKRSSAGIDRMAEEAKRDDRSAVRTKSTGRPVAETKGRTNQTVGQGGGCAGRPTPYKDRRPYRRAYSGQTVRINRHIIRNRTAAPFRGCGRLHQTSGQTARHTPPASRTVLPTAAGAIDSQATRDIGQKILQY